MSNVIKSSSYVPLDSKKLIEAATIKSTADSRLGEHGQAIHQAAELEQAVRDRQIDAKIERMLDEAREEAATIVRTAREQMDELRKQTEQELAEWLEAHKQQAAQEAEAAARSAEEKAYEEGLIKGKEEAEKRYQEHIQTAVEVLEEAEKLKREIIAEAEPFLLELSTQIAEKIIEKQLSLEPQWTLDLIRQVLMRERRRGKVTLCVSPEQFAFVREARDELKLALDSQAELIIVPDSTVQDNGCVVRTDFGSLDARIDSQLAEVKQALLQAYAAEQGGDDA